MDADDLDALSLLLDTNRLYPDERRALVSLLGRVQRLEKVATDAGAVVDALDAMT